MPPRRAGAGPLLAVAAALAACGPVAQPMVQWQVTFTASVDRQPRPSTFTFGPASSTEEVLDISLQSAYGPRPPRNPGAALAPVPQALAAVWAPPALAPYALTDAASPAAQPTPAFTALSPGRGWALVAAVQGKDSPRADAAVPLSADVRPALAQRCVLTLQWQDPSGTWWRQRFGVGGGALSRPKPAPAPPA